MAASSLPSLTVVLLALPDTTASTLFGLYDLLLGARRDWQMLMHGVDAESPLQPLIVSRDGQPLCAANGVRIEPQAIEETALMTVEGEKDDISGVGQTQAAHALCPAIPSDRRVHRLQPGVGHFGIFNGRRWREEIYPELREFIRRNN